MASMLRKSFEKLTVSDKDDRETYCGFWGLGKLYRVCRDDENIENAIKCKAGLFREDRRRTVEQHINSGSENNSRFISTTLSRDVALKWAFYTMENKYNIQERFTPLRIIKIDISKIPPETARGMINLTVEEVRNHFLRGATQVCRAKASQEVLFQDQIPEENPRTGEIVYKLWDDPPQPPKPKPKKPRKPKNEFYFEEEVMAQRSEELLEAFTDTHDV